MYEWKIIVNNNEANGSVNECRKSSLNKTFTKNKKWNKQITL